MEKLIVVDKQDKILGYESWEKCHSLKGILHRAFSIFVFNKKGEILLQKRSKYKKLWPLYWSNTCCSHPRENEDIVKVGERRLKEEFGFTTKLGVLYKFCYRAVYKKIGSENELCYVLIGKYDGKVKPDKKEIADYKWVSLNYLKKDLSQNPDDYTPWFKKEMMELLSKDAEKMRGICGDYFPKRLWR